MEPPTEPSKPAESEADAALAASAANAVEQWRTYQNAYYLYQQQQAAYEQYMMKQATLTNPEDQAAAYNEYLAAHQSYQKQLEQYEQQKYYQEYYATGQPPPVAAAPIVYPTAAQITYQPPPQMPAPPTYSTPLANVDPFYKKSKDHYRDRSQYKKRSENSEKKTKVYTTTTFYANPEDEELFPADLKALFLDLECKLCVCKMNSHISANVHYQSKVHERKIVQWLKEWCETTGTPMPIRQTRKAVDVEPVGPNSLRCEACDLPLTSIQHANQHYTGKRHQMVVRGKKNPAGKGYFNADGTWTRTPNDGPADDDRFGIGTSFKNKTHYNAREAKRAKLEPPPEPSAELLGTTATPTTTIPATPAYSMPQTPVYNMPQTPVYSMPQTPVYSMPQTPVYGATPMYTAPQATPMYTAPQVTPSYGAPQAAPVYAAPQAAPVYAAPQAAPVYAAPQAAPVYAAPQATPTYGAPPATPTYQAAQPAEAAPSYPPQQATQPHNADQAPPPQAAQTTVEDEILRKESADCVDPTGVFCLVCQIGVTSKTVMETHLKGVKHLRKLKMSGRMAPPTDSGTESILETLHKPPQQNDWSLYRMPSGKYYCKSCNSILADEKLFSQHWYGKKHKLKVKQEMEELAATEGNGAATKQEPKKFYNRRPFGKNRFVQSQAH